jgi:hypothetical protein
MRPIAVVSVVVGLLSAIPMAGAQAEKPSDGCPPAASGFVLYPINNPGWTLGVDPVPSEGEEPLWDITLPGVIEVFGSLESAADALGFESVDALYEWVLAGWLSFDKNGDAMVCVQDMPNTPGIPPFIFNFIDNRASVPG